MAKPILSQLIIYPIKSMAGIQVKQARLTTTGLENDRRWMMVDEKGRFLTQRRYPQLALISVTINDQTIQLTTASNSPLELPLKLKAGNSVEVRVWNDQVTGLQAKDNCNQWISDYLQIPVRFIYMPDECFRSVDENYRLSTDNQVSFADGFPYLLISEASLDDLNAHLISQHHSAVEMSRFRPNLVVSATGAYEEDNWREIRIHDQDFHIVKPCSRCIMTTVDANTGTKGLEPLQTLKGYRQRQNNTYFGQNLIHQPLRSTNANLQVRQAVTVIRQSSTSNLPP